MASKRQVNDDSEEEYNGNDLEDEEDEDFDAGAKKKMQKRKNIFVDDAAEDDGDAVSRLLHPTYTKVALRGSAHCFNEDCLRQIYLMHAPPFVKRFLYVSSYVPLVKWYSWKSLLGARPTCVHN